MAGVAALSLAPRTATLKEADASADFLLLEKLGEGSFGKVYRAQQHSINRHVAIKVVPVAQDTGEVAREIETLKECDSDNIVRYYGSFQRGPELWIVMEFCEGSSLCDIMEATRRCFTEEQIGAVMAGTLEGLIYLHRLNKIHRDVKAGNLLLSERGIIKLADFGVAAQMASTMSRRGTVIGTPFWMAPEVISGGPEAGYNAKADVWSLGITAIELAEGAPPHSDMHPMRAIFLIPTLPPPTLGAKAGGWREQIVDFVGRCVVKEVDQRPFTSELLSHPLIAEGRAAQQTGVLLRLMETSREPLRVWRLQQDAEEADKKGKLGSGQLGSGVFASGSGAFGTSRSGDHQDIDAEAIRGVAKAMAGLTGGGGAVGTMVVHDADSGSGGGGGGFGTMVVNGDEAAGGCGGGGSMVVNPAAVAAAAPSGAAAVPAFMRQFIPEQNSPANLAPRLDAARSPRAAPAASAAPPSRGASDAAGRCAGCSSASAAAAAAASTSAAPPSEREKSMSVHRMRQNTRDNHGHADKSNKYDFSHLGLAEINEELASIGANLERDMGKLRRQYEKRDRALRAARALKTGAAPPASTP